MKVILILCCIICLVITTSPNITGTALGNKVIGEDSLLFKTIGTLSKVSNFFAMIATKTVDTVQKIPDYWNTFVAGLKDWWENGTAGMGNK